MFPRDKEDFTLNEILFITYLLNADIDIESVADQVQRSKKVLIKLFDRFVAKDSNNNYDKDTLVGDIEDVEYSERQERERKKKQDAIRFWLPDICFRDA